MATATIRPNGDNSPNAWTIESGSCPLHHDCVDEVTPDGNILYEIETGHADTEEFDMDNVPGDVSEITGIQVYVYGKFVGGGTVGIWYYDGTWIGSLTPALTTAYSWKSVSWTGLTLTKAQGDALTIRMFANTIAKGSIIYVNTLYVIITYTLPAVTGWPHKWNGMTPDKFNGMTPNKILGMG